MKAIIISAGSAGRLGELVKDKPKGLLDINGKTLIDRQISLLRKNGIDNVIIITGRGKISQGGGILQNQTPKWLNSPQLRQRIIAFSGAQASDGGSGAIYVLLRRLR